MNLIAHCLTPEEHVYGIRSLIEFGKLLSPLAHSVLYLHDIMTRGYP